MWKCPFEVSIIYEGTGRLFSLKRVKTSLLVLIVLSVDPSNSKKEQVINSMFCRVLPSFFRAVESHAFMAVVPAVASNFGLKCS